MAFCVDVSFGLLSHTVIGVLSQKGETSGPTRIPSHNPRDGIIGAPQARIYASPAASRMTCNALRYATSRGVSLSLYRFPINPPMYKKSSFRYSYPQPRTL